MCQRGAEEKDVHVGTGLHQQTKGRQPRFLGEGRQGLYGILVIHECSDRFYSSSIVEM
jgi:hypothetical protein